VDQLDIVFTGPHAVASVFGTPTLSGWLKVIDQLHLATQDHPECRTLLLNLSAAAATHDAFTEALVGEHIGARLSHLRRIASVVPEGARTGINQRLARRNGANLTVFESERDALEWLNEAAADGS